jgi:flagellar motor switch protein FliN/FliY
MGHMSTDLQNNQTQIPSDVKFSEMQLSAVAEIQNISMGSAATAVSNLLNAKVWITTPQIKILKYKELSYPDLEPSIHVRINYIKGVSGSNTMILKQSDVQLMLNQLMGLPLVVTDDFVFDELNISAVCEVMNQMMGSSATALSEFLGEAIDISTPIAKIKDSNEPLVFDSFDPEDYVVAIHFNLTIDGVINSEFVSIIEIDLARALASKMLQGIDGSEEAQEAPPAPAQTVAQQTPPPPVAKQEPTSQPTQQPFQQPTMQQQPAQQPAYQQPMYQQPVYQQPIYEQPMYQQPVYQQPVYQQPQPQPQQSPINVQSIKLQQFDNFDTPVLSSEQQDNLKLLMSVPLTVSVEIGSAKKKVKEILEFNQGTVIELDRQAGAPVDVIVNGNLIAKGDVVVIDDNFAVRVTEIVKSKFLDTLGDKE